MTTDHRPAPVSVDHPGVVRAFLGHEPGLGQLPDDVPALHMDDIGSTKHISIESMDDCAHRFRNVLPEHEALTKVRTSFSRTYQMRQTLGIPAMLSEGCHLWPFPPTCPGLCNCASGRSASRSCLTESPPGRGPAVPLMTAHIVVPDEFRKSESIKRNSIRHAHPCTDETSRG